VNPVLGNLVDLYRIEVGEADVVAGRKVCCRSSARWITLLINKHTLCNYLRDVVTTVPILAFRGLNYLVDGMKDVKVFTIP